LIFEKSILIYFVLLKPEKKILEKNRNVNRETNSELGRFFVFFLENHLFNVYNINNTFQLDLSSFLLFLAILIILNKILINYFSLQAFVSLAV
jgi:hypothetical protein